MVALNLAESASILLMVGADEADQIKRVGGKVRVNGATDLFKLIGPDVGYHRMHIRPNMLRAPKQADISHYKCYLNLITEPENNDRVLDTLKKVLRGKHGRVVNRPEAVMRTTRDQVAKLLSGIDGLIVPRAIRLRASKPGAARSMVDKAGFNFPLIVREFGTHTGKIVGLFDAPDALDGLAPGDYLATEFVDFQSADGLYRKGRVYYFGPTRIFRHLLISDQWNVHTAQRKTLMAQRPDLIAEERALFDDPGGAFPPSVIAIFEAVRARMPIDFFGMDFGVMPDGRLVLFEANATMNFFPLWEDPNFMYIQQCLRPAHRAFRAMLGMAPLPAFAADPEDQA